MRRQTFGTLESLLDRVHVGDARDLSKQLPSESVDLTLTSPPYFDMKDYGRANQIGFGQKYDDYLNDLAAVFAEVHRATKADGSLWIIVDTFRQAQEVFPLPFDIAARLTSFGWILRDIVIWKKERTVPWTRSGINRKIFEYILVFSKTRGAFRNDHDLYRDSTDLKRWWVRYPERYNPKGKAPEEIWSYDIPTQGSWGESYVRHFCPLPSELVSRIVQQTTRERDVILDPFSGSGTVPTVSTLLGRHYIGFELNRDYVKMFEKHLAKARKKAPELLIAPAAKAADEFASTIAELRILKYGRLILRELNKITPSSEASVFVHRKRGIPQEKFKHYRAEYLIVLAEERHITKAQDIVQKLVSRPPLTKFGVEPSIAFVVRPSSKAKAGLRASYYEYTQTNSHFHTGKKRREEAWESTGKLFSPVRLEVEEPNG